MNLDFVPIVSENLYLKNIEGENLVFVLDQEIPSWIFINQDGLQILKLFDGVKTINEITEELQLIHRIQSKNDLSKVVIDFVDHLNKNQILRTAEKKKEDLKSNSFQGIALEITGSCNLDCKHCYLSAGAQFENEITLKQIKQLLDDTKSLGGTSVSIGGGEPMMRDDFFDIVDYANEIGLLITVGTNGTLITREIAQKLSAYPVKIQISLDGATPKTHDLIRGKGRFEQSIKAIDLLIDEGKGNDLVLAYTVMKPNLYELSDIVDFALEKNIHFIQFPPLTSSGRAKENWDDLKISNDEKLWFWNYISKRSMEVKSDLDLLADCFSLNVDNIGAPRRCSIGTQIRIDPKGNVYPCQCFHFGETYKLGNINIDSFKDIVLGDKIKRIIKQCYGRPSKIEDCNQCRWMNFCGSGCMGNAFEEHGTVYKPDSCSVRKRWLEKLFEVKLQEICQVSIID